MSFAFIRNLHNTFKGIKKMEDELIVDFKFEIRLNWSLKLVKFLDKC